MPSTEVTATKPASYPAVFEMAIPMFQKDSLLFNI